MMKYYIYWNTGNAFRHPVLSHAVREGINKTLCGRGISGTNEGYACPVVECASCRLQLSTTDERVEQDPTVQQRHDAAADADGGVPCAVACPVCVARSN